MAAIVAPKTQSDAAKRTVESDAQFLAAYRQEDQLWAEQEEPAPVDEITKLRRERTSSGQRASEERALLSVLHGDVAHAFYRYSPTADFWWTLAAGFIYLGRLCWSLLAKFAAAWLIFVIWHRWLKPEGRMPRRSILGRVRPVYRKRFEVAVFGAYCTYNLSHWKWVRSVTTFTTVIASTLSLYLVWVSLGNILRGRKTQDYSEGLPRRLFTYKDSLETNWRNIDHAMSCEIRLLQLKPWRPFQTTIEASLKTVTLEMAQDYQAISYTWGTSVEKTKSLIVDGKYLRCTEATYNAIYHASSMWSSRRVWIDYVCIDQSNNKEKSGQVELMRHIYARASNVRAQLTPISLGPAHWHGAKAHRQADTDSVAALIERFASFINTWDPSHAEITEFLEREIHTYGESRLTDLIGFFANPWFSRVWIIQEVITSSMVTVHYNDSFIPLGSMSLAAGAFADKELQPLLRRYSGNGNLARKNALRFMNILRIRHLHKKHGLFAPYLHSDPDTAALFRVSLNFAVTPLSMLLSECSSFEATNARDKVYALLGLIIDGKALLVRERLSPDYSKSVADVMKSAARYLAQRRSIFDSLSNVGIGLHTGKGTEGLPSWVPDWAAPPICAPLHIPRSPELKTSAYQASRGALPYLAWGAEEDSLVSSGGCIDRIVEVGPVNIPIDAADHPEVDIRDSHLSEVRRVLSWYHESLQLAQRYHRKSAQFISLTNKEMEEAIWRTMIGDRYPFERPAPKVLGEHCRRWLGELESLNGSKTDLHSRWLVGDLSPSSQEAIAWMEAFEKCAAGRRLFVTARGFIGMGPPGATVDDEVVLIFGAATPFVVRHPEGSKCGLFSSLGCNLPFHMVGECYIHGLMDGEGLRLVSTQGGDRLRFV